KIHRTIPNGTPVKIPGCRRDPADEYLEFDNKVLVSLSAHHLSFRGQWLDPRSIDFGRRYRYIHHRGAQLAEVELRFLRNLGPTSSGTSPLARSSRAASASASRCPVSTNSPMASPASPGKARVPRSARRRCSPRPALPPNSASPTTAMVGSASASRFSTTTS